jgi:hypothetical protein
MVHFPRERRSSRPLIVVLVLLGWWILLLGALVGIVSHLSAAVTGIGISAGCCTLARSIVGHSLAWCLVADLLLGALLTLIAILLLGTLLVLVIVLLVVLGTLRKLTTVPLIRRSLTALRESLLRVRTWASVAARRLPLELSLLCIHLLALVVDDNSAVHQFLEARVGVAHQLQLQSIIQTLQEETLLVRVPGHLIWSIS